MKRRYFLVFIAIIFTSCSNGVSEPTKEVVNVVEEQPYLTGEIADIVYPEELPKTKQKSNKVNKDKSIKQKSISKEEPTKQEVVYPNMLKIPSSNIDVKTVVGGFTQKDVDTNDITYVEDWSNYMNCDLYFGHSTRSLSNLYNTKVGDTITTCKVDGSVAHYIVTLSKDGILEESTTDRGELWLDGVHYNKGFIKDRKTGDILFAYSDDGYDNNNLAIITCYDKYNSNGRWVVMAERIPEEFDEQQKLIRKRSTFKEKYLSKTLYSKKNTIVFKKTNDAYKAKQLGVVVTYPDKIKSKHIIISDILKLPVYTLDIDVKLKVSDTLTISNSKGKFKQYKVSSIKRGKQVTEDYDSKTGFLRTYIKSDNDKIIFSYNGEIEETCSAIITMETSDKYVYVVRLKEV